MLNKIINKISLFIELRKKSSIIFLKSEYDKLKKEAFNKDKRILASYGFKVYSQFDEDGIINEIFKRIGTTNKIFVEFGVGEGTENNTIHLLIQGWTGLWIEGSSKFVSQINNIFHDFILNNKLIVVNSFITTDNIDKIISENIQTKEIDLLSIDIDGNDSHILSEIKSINPRVIVLEYNAKFGPILKYCMNYNENYIWEKSDNFGASLKHFELQLSNLGYNCVGCNIAGTNAFFVKKDLVTEEKFYPPFTSENHFNFARYELIGIPFGHPTIKETFKNFK